MKSIIVFVGSVISSLFFLLIERLAGINWDYHPDADTYVSTYKEMSDVLLENGMLSWFNNSYYLVSYLVDGDISILIAINILAYAITNVIFFNFFDEYLKKNEINNGLKSLFFIWIFIFPYRLHLSIHILKDSLIILFYSIIASNIKGRSIAWWPLLLLRVFAVFYLIPLLPLKYLKIVVFCLTIVLLLFPNEIFLLLADKNEVSMTFREFDTVPTFSQFGVYGAFIRAIIWPFLTLTGVFLILSPSIAFFPVAVGIFFTQAWSKFFLKKWGVTLGIFLALSTIACVVNGFTSYIRYTFPIIVVLPLILLKKNSKINN
ncbi:hypothetical protein [Flavobacterium sp. XS1P27]|uniref:hypothetical protein n=1 Tax=unclassified Flavobacterium TaxID=196869 RepID=UPI003AAB83C0